MIKCNSLLLFYMFVFIDDYDSKLCIVLGTVNTISYHVYSLCNFFVYNNKPITSTGVVSGFLGWRGTEVVLGILATLCYCCSPAVANTTYVEEDQIEDSWRFLSLVQPLHKSKKQFVHSFPFDVPTIRIEWPDDVCSTSTVSSFRKRLSSLFSKALAT